LRGVLILITGTILAPGWRTVTSALSIMGLREIATFPRVLNRNRWSPRDLEALKDGWKPKQAAWCAKTHLTFSDALAIVWLAP
jgi:hypothetical protein